jgi:predicted dehydrogenase
MALRFGLLGTGHWAAQTQGAALAVHPDAEFVGVWGRDPAKADALAARYGVRGYADVDALIADVDAVAVALPPDVQAELALRAARAGRHLLLDKPLSLSTATADPIVAAVQERGLASIVFFTNRFDDGVEAFLSECATRGRWDGARVTLFASIFQPGNPYGESPWRREHGGLWDVGPHALSVVVPLLGPVRRVAALDGPHDTVHLLLGHADGAASTMSLTVDAPPEATMFDFAFHGSAGVASLPRRGGTAVGSFGRAIDALVAGAGRENPRHPCDVHFGREVVAALEAAEQARRAGVTVEI